MDPLDARDVREMFTRIVGIVCFAFVLGIAGVALAYVLHLALIAAEIGHYWAGSWIGF